MNPSTIWVRWGGVDRRRKLWECLGSRIAIHGRWSRKPCQLHFHVFAQPSQKGCAIPRGRIVLDQVCRGAQHLRQPLTRGGLCKGPSTSSEERLWQHYHVSRAGLEGIGRGEVEEEGRRSTCQFHGSGRRKKELGRRSQSLPLQWLTQKGSNLGL